MAAVFTLETYHGTKLSVDVTTCQLCHFPEDAAATTPLLLLAGGRLGRRCLPFTRAQTTGIALVAQPARMLSLTDIEGGAVALSSPLTYRYLSAVSGSEIAFDRQTIGGWERFRLLPFTVAEGGDVEEIRQLVAIGDRVLESSLSWRQVFSAILTEGPSPVIAQLVEAVWPLLSLDEFDAWARELRPDSAQTRHIADLFPGDFWATSALPELIGWAARRDAQRFLLGDAASAVPAPAGPQVLGPDRDHLARDGVDGTFASFAHAAHASLRLSVVPRQGTAIVATARSEGIYLLEWIAHHRLLGAEAFFLYTNDNEDGSDDLLAALHAAGVISWVKSELATGVSAQNKAYGHALNLNAGLRDYRWALFIDLDEFLVLDPERFPQISDFARRHELTQTDAVGINWVLVGSGGRHHWNEAPLTQRNTSLLGEVNPHIKVMMSPRHYIQAHPHFPFADPRRAPVFRLAAGEIHRHRNQTKGVYHAQAFADDPSDADACLYHYLYKSVDEFIWKYSRNRGDYPMSAGMTFESLDEPTVMGFLDQHRSDNVRPSARIQPGAVALNEEIARLRALPGVAAAEQQVIALFQRRLAVAKVHLTETSHLVRLGAPGRELQNLIDHAAD